MTYRYVPSSLVNSVSHLRGLAGPLPAWFSRLVCYIRGTVDNLIHGKVVRVPPNYAFHPRFHAGDIVIDVGTGNDPDLSKYLISKYGVESFAVDPTRKHASALREYEKKLPGFHYLPHALGAQSGKVDFYESTTNVSGSILPGHRNIINDPTTKYAVEMITMAELLQMAGSKHIALMKIDIEGAEFELLAALEPGLLRRVRQLLVEFHHDTVQGKTWRDTEEAISRLKGMGMKALVYNGRDCLFYW